LKLIALSLIISVAWTQVLDVDVEPEEEVFETIEAPETSELELGTM